MKIRYIGTESYQEYPVTGTTALWQPEWVSDVSDDRATALVALGTFVYEDESTWANQLVDHAAEHAAMGSGGIGFVSWNPGATLNTTYSLQTGTTGPNGTYYYFITGVTADGEGSTYTGEPTAITTAGGGQFITLLQIPTIDDPRVIARNLYRTVNIAGDVGDTLARAPRLVHTFNDNTTTTWQDTVADGDLGVFAPYVDTTGLVWAVDGEYVGSWHGSSQFLGSDGPSARNLGYANVGYGRYVFSSMAGGVRNSAFGVDALMACTSGAENTAIGTHALGAVTTGKYNCGVGFAAGGTATTHNSNTAVGAYALNANTSSLNTAVGYLAASNQTNNGQTTAVGANAGKNITTGSGSVIVGYGAVGGAGTAGLTGDFNISIGYQSAYVLTGAAAYNTVIGFQAGYALTSGGSNTIIGMQAGKAISTNGSVVHIGAHAGRFDTAANTFYVNNQSRTDAAGDQTKSLLYGQFSANAIDQRLTVNGLFRTIATTVSALPAASVGAGFRAFVTDANATTFASIVAGGGSNGVPVYSDGTVWRIG